LKILAYAQQNLNAEDTYQTMLPLLDLIKKTIMLKRAIPSDLLDVYVTTIR